ncbi:hypothetical protein [[Pantoea] beijingensis]|nr:MULTISPECIES: hypothetical protein [Erwiniaceae]
MNNTLICLLLYTVNALTRSFPQPATMENRGVQQYSGISKPACHGVR